jgi:hypothetical protein
MKSGKTTLYRVAFPHKAYVNLEAPDERRFALKGPRGFLNAYQDRAIFDEIQRTPDLLSFRQPLIDKNQRLGGFF